MSKLIERDSAERSAARQAVYQLAPKSCPVKREIAASKDSSEILVVKNHVGKAKMVCRHNPRDVNCEGCPLVQKVLLLT